MTASAVVKVLIRSSGNGGPRWYGALVANWLQTIFAILMIVALPLGFISLARANQSPSCTPEAAIQAEKASEPCRSREAP
jgi:hypothetical protein